jgi:vacuolar iron transporter family protein
MEKQISEDIRKKLLIDQQHEIDSHHIYSNLAKKVKDENNRQILQRIANDEKKHYELLSKYTGVEVKPGKFKVWFFTMLTTLFGLTFGLKLMEKAEQEAQDIDYAGLDAHIPEVKDVMKDEEEHEHELLNMINEERLKYVGSIVLGLNDALVELTGALAGLTFALQNTSIIALSGLVTGIAASFSMAASEYLSRKAEGGTDAVKSALYTGGAYIITVFLLVLPYLLLNHYIICLVLTLSISVIIIFVFNYYISVAKDYNFWRRFLEMAGISLGVAALSFGIGIVLRLVFGVEM